LLDIDRGILRRHFAPKSTPRTLCGRATLSREGVCVHTITPAEKRQ
jgi:hypothetical protein